MPHINDYQYQQIHDKKLMESVCVAAVVRVMGFDSSKMTVDVQPLSKHLQNGRYVSQPPILSIPVAFTRSGGFILRPWVKVGDTGVVIYLDHDLDSAVAGAKETKPLTERNHATTDAIFIGGIVAGNYKVSSLPEESLTLSTEDGETFIAVTKKNVQIKGDVVITGSISVTENSTVEGDSEVNGDITADGKITAKGDVFAECSVSGAHHIHRGDSGGSTSQPS